MTSIFLFILETERDRAILMKFLTRRVILATLSKGLITQKLLQLQVFLQICCSATLSFVIRWYIVWGPIACHK